MGSDEILSICMLMKEREKMSNGAENYVTQPAAM